MIPPEDTPSWPILLPSACSWSVSNCISDIAASLANLATAALTSVSRAAAASLHTRDFTALPLWLILTDICAETQGGGLLFTDDPMRQMLHIDVLHVQSITHTSVEEAVSHTLQDWLFKFEAKCNAMPTHLVACSCCCADLHCSSSCCTVSLES